MKKILKIILPLLLITGLVVGCGNNKSTSQSKQSEKVINKVFVNENKRAKNVVTYYAHGDKIFKSTERSEYNFSEYSESSVDKTKERFREISEEHQGVKGVKEKLEFNEQENTATRTLIVDYTKVDKKKLLDLSVIVGTDKNGNYSLKKTAKELKLYKFEEKEKMVDSLTTERR
ncbi:DUF1307 domain-containing protein [Lactobacillus sp. YT155]|uniref:DUF1307 domain-containing protein n=1 Tax=Lactobacillus sp. YT155 TaxID=3060955 RepID=UPI00265F7CAC|nr:DUF1307 domain-containing protein [Lactobacillus sp. YT155]MDO1604578.1 DUF1307 domain-containing protein [Lactobacillus sp. YT155]